MRFVWERGGVVAFVAIKSLLIVLPLALFNAMKLRRYWLIRRTVWVTIFGYCLIYGLFFYLGNY
jgi:hypothetical protein